MEVAYSLDQQLRLRRFKNGHGVIEIKSRNGAWTWCIWKSAPWERAQAAFDHQCQYHKEPRQ